MRLECAMVAVSLALAGCGLKARQKAAAELTGGDPQRGGVLIVQYGCGSCHTIVGLAGAHGLVGPPLTSVGDRQYLAGILPNTPGNMVRWVQNPRIINEKTAMPNLGVNEPDATDIAAYLYSLK